MNMNEMSQKLYNFGKMIGLSENSSLYPALTTVDRIFSDGLVLYFNNGEYHYVILERGREVKHFQSDDTIEILYYVFKDITFSLAQDYEVEHRNEREDFRKIVFGKQLELLENISSEYRLIREKEIETLLKKAPYSLES